MELEPLGESRRTFLGALLVAVAFAAILPGCAAPYERLADKCYAFGGKPHVKSAGEALDVECK